MAHPCCTCDSECYCNGDIDDGIVSLTPKNCNGCEGCQEEESLAHEDDEDFEEDDEDFEMPTPCQKCGKWFDLHDGAHSDKWFPNTIICQKCSSDELLEISRDDEIEELKMKIDDAEITIKYARLRLIELEVDIQLNGCISCQEQIRNDFYKAASLATNEVEKIILQSKLDFYKKLASKIKLITNGELDINEYAEEVTIKIVIIDTKIESLIH